MRTPRLRTALLALYLAAAFSLAGGDAAAQPAPAPTDAQAIEKAKEHYAKGRQLYDAGDKQGAVGQFKEAYRLTKNPLLLYNIGFVLDELKERKVALHYYEKFLSDAPNDERAKENRGFATERLKVLKKEIAEEDAAGDVAEKARLEAEAKAKADAEARAKAEEDERRARSVKEFTHVVVGEAPPGLPLDIIAKIPIDADWILTVFYRGAGEDEFRSARMKPRFTEMVARVPATAVLGSSVQYYIEARNGKGELVASSGRASSPNIVYLDPKAKPHYYKDLEGKSPSGEGGDEMGSGDPVVKLPGADAGKRRSRRYAKWGTTGGAAAFLTASMVFYIVAMDKASQMESLAYEANNGCDGAPAPCQSFGPAARDLQSSGESFETWTKVSLVLGSASAVAAGVFWYLDIRDLQKEEAAAAASPDAKPESSARRGTRIAGVPIVGDGFVGGAAVIEF